MRNVKNICMNCFGELGSDRVCKSCRRHADDTPAPPHHLPQRTVLNDKYLIYKALGEGGFGITYLAWDMTLGIKVAIKEYFPCGYVNRVPKSCKVLINRKENQAASNRGLKRFVEEARNLAKIKNLSGIVNVRDFFSANGTAYIVMEFLDGVSLKKYIQRKGGKLAVKEIMAIMRPVLDSLVEVHETGIIHRDISPDNIIVTKTNQVKLIDFGAAKQANLDGKSLSIVLKQGFAPEEQYRTHGEQGPWTDVYALGVTVYYAITGQLPPESIQRLVKDTIVKPSALGAEITVGQENALMKALAVKAQNRYQNVTQFINGLYYNRATTLARATQSVPVRTVTSPATVTRTDAKPEPVKRATPAKSDTAKAATAKNDTAKAATAKTSAAKADTAKPATVKNDTAKASTAKTAKDDTAKAATKTDTTKAATAKATPARAATAKTDTAKAATAKPATAKTDTTKATATKTDTTKPATSRNTKKEVISPTVETTVSIAPQEKSDKTITRERPKRGFWSRLFGKK